MNKSATFLKYLPTLNSKIGMFFLKHFIMNCVIFFSVFRNCFLFHLKWSQKEHRDLATILPGTWRVRSHLWDSHSQRALFLLLFSWSPQESKEVTARMHVPTWRLCPPEAHISSPWGPRTPNGLRPASGPMQASSLIHLKRQRPARCLGSTGVWGWILMWRLEWSRAAPHREQRSRGWGEEEVGWLSHTTMFPRGTLQEARHSMLRPTCPTYYSCMCCHDRRTGTFCFTVCSHDFN